MAIPQLHQFSPLLPSLNFFLLHLLQYSNAQPSPILPNTTGYHCNANQTASSCQAYAFYRAHSPDFLNLIAVSDLFSVSRPMISGPSNISSPSSPLVSGQSLFIPLTCSCNMINPTFDAISYANISYTIMENDTYYLVSTYKFLNLTSYESAEVVNPSLAPTNLSTGDDVIFPIFCKCPNRTQLQNQENYMISYVYQPSDNYSSVASRFNSTVQSIIDVNGDNLRPFETMFIPVNRLPVLSQPAVVASPPPKVSVPAESPDRTGTVRGLAIGLGITGLLLILILGVWIYKEVAFKHRLWVKGDEEKQKQQLYGDGKEIIEEKQQQQLYGVEKEAKGSSEIDVKLIANVSDCLDKNRVFGIEELREATNGFDESCLIQGSVYKGSIDCKVYAIKKMKWNAYEELKILQKVNHGNLVKLEGFGMDPVETYCYLVYEYVENGSLYSWLYEERDEKMSWKTRLKIAIDIANGLQYIHEHTRPKVVHKDIKSSNILVDSNMRAKIANFGLAKLGSIAITRHIVGTQGYIAPEYFADGIVSTKMDVFAFGVVLLELLTAREAIDEEGSLLSTSVIRTFEGTNEQEKARKLREWIDRDILREACSMESLIGILNIAIACLHKDPSKRPSMVEIVYALCKSENADFDASDDRLGSPQVKPLCQWIVPHGKVRPINVG